MMMVELYQVGHNNDFCFSFGWSFIRFLLFFIDNIYTGFTSSLLFYHIIRNRSASNG